MKDTDTSQKQTMTSAKVSVFHSILNRLEGWFSTNEPEDELIDYVVDIIEPKLKQVRGYKKRLREPLQVCREHCREIVAGIPGPITFRRNGYGSDPFIRAAFLKSELFENLMDRADEKTTKPALPGSKRVALLTMASKERTIFGRKQHGEMMVADAAMRAITFTDHTIVGLSSTLSDSRSALEMHALDVIAEAVARQLSEVRDRLVDLRQRQEWLHAMEKMFGTKSGGRMGYSFTPYDPEQSQKQKEVEHLLEETQNELEAAKSSSETPEDWLRIVGNLLSKPGDILSMQLVSLRLNWKNVITDDPSEKADTINLAIFNLADEMQREGVLVEYQLD